MRIRRLVITLLTLAAASSRADANLIVNGGFEVPVTMSFTTIPAGDPSLVGWTVVSGSVDVTRGFLPAFEGDQVLDLDGSSAGTIEQSFVTVGGMTYLLTFAYSDNLGGTEPASANVSVFGAGAPPLLSQDVTHGGSSFANPNYVVFSATFTADSSTTRLRFTSLNPSSSIGGIYLDAVSVTAQAAAVTAPEPASVALLGLGAAGLVGYRVRRRAPAAA